MATARPGRPPVRRPDYLYEPDRLERRFDLCLVLGQEGRELVGRLVEVDPAALLERVLPGRPSTILAMAPDSAFISLSRRLGAANTPRQLHQRDVDSLLLQRRDIDSRAPARRRRSASARSLPACDLRRELLVAADTGRDVSAQSIVGERLTAAGVRDVVDVRRVDARGPGRSARPGCGRCHRPTHRPRTTDPGLAFSLAAQVGHAS